MVDCRDSWTQELQLICPFGVGIFNFLNKWFDLTYVKTTKIPIVLHTSNNKYIIIMFAQDNPQETHNQSVFFFEE